ncbi:MAG TPA: hypothetical protein VG408_09750, partial [Actinomycetota bacterium]|nr:hypothetical protein [Actinomycetota bacterium]
DRPGKDDEPVVDVVKNKAITGPQVLPFTGSAPVALAALATVLIGLGTLAVTTSRRRRPE